MHADFSIVTAVHASQCPLVVDEFRKYTTRTSFTNHALSVRVAARKSLQGARSPRNSPMYVDVLVHCANDQCLRAVVALVCDVMNSFARFKQPAQFYFRNDPMPKHPALDVGRVRRTKY